MTEPVFTPWLKNPSTGECPVPDWAEVYEVTLAPDEIVESFKNINAKTWVWSIPSPQSMLDITHYRYAIPASLAELARKREVWDTMVNPRTEIQGRNGWSKEDWEIARRGLGLNEIGFPREDLDKYSVREETNKRRAHSYVDGNGNLHITVNENLVNHPSYYMLAPDMEAIDVIRSALTPEEYMGYLKGSILKYRLRAGRKGDATEDLAKSDWYRAEAIKGEKW